MTQSPKISLLASGYNEAERLRAGHIYFVMGVEHMPHVEKYAKPYEEGQLGVSFIIREERAKGDLSATKFITCLRDNLDQNCQSFYHPKWTNDEVKLMTKQLREFNLK